MFLSLCFSILSCSEFEVISDTSEQDFVHNKKDQDADRIVELQDTGTQDDIDYEGICEIQYEPNPFIDDVVSFVPGSGAGFGQEAYPDIVFGPPKGQGSNAGSLDVLSLGSYGEMVVVFDDWIIHDGDGADVIIFENPFTGWVELAEISASMDGETWHTWPCDTETWVGCAGITPVLSHPDNCIDARDLQHAGGDVFDLADIGLEQAKYIRIRDLGTQMGGFDLDSIAIVNGHWE